MLLQNKLKGIQIVLGSQSPRRKELLEAMDIDFVVEVRSVDENIDQSLSAIDIVKNITLAKLSAFEGEEYQGKLAITADTIVVSPYGTVLGKPETEHEAFDMIKMLLGEEHSVVTGVALQYQGQIVYFSETTLVRFRDLKDEEILYYIDKFKPYDKAGAYGIQEWIGHIGVDCIVGSFENVVGLPTQRLYKELDALIK